MEAMKLVPLPSTQLLAVDPRRGRAARHRPAHHRRRGRRRVHRRSRAGGTGRARRARPPDRPDGPPGGRRHGQRGRRAARVRVAADADPGHERQGGRGRWMSCSGQNFADGDGKLPRTLEKFLGDRGKLRSFVDELFDESKRDSAIGRMKTLLGTYFDGDASRLAVLLDPTRMNSPLHQFRTEVTDGFARLNDRLTAIEAAATARATERSRSRPPRAATSRICSRRCSATSRAAPATSSSGPPTSRATCSARRRATSS